MALAATTGIDPTRILAWDAEIFQLYSAYLGGLARGRNARRR